MEENGRWCPILSGRVSHSLKGLAAVNFQCFNFRELYYVNNTSYLRRRAVFRASEGKEDFGVV
jgi:hypothetical protein